MNIKKLTPNQFWLLQHIIISFWHTFGIANGLDIMPEDIKEITYKRGKPKKILRVKAEVMQKKLKEYIKWLESYAKVWDRKENGDIMPNCKDYKEFLKSENEYKSRKDILKMLDLIYEMQDRKEAQDI